MAVRGLTKVFKDFWGRPKARAVDNVDFEVRRGEVFGLLGPNGAGKTTTIGIITSLVTKTAGTVKIFGIDIDVDFSAAKRLIGVLHQQAVPPTASKPEDMPT